MDDCRGCALQVLLLRLLYLPCGPFSPLHSDLFGLLPCWCLQHQCTILSASTVLGPGTGNDRFVCRCRACSLPVSSASTILRCPILRFAPARHRLLSSLLGGISSLFGTPIVYGGCLGVWGVFVYSSPSPVFIQNSVAVGGLSVGFVSLWRYLHYEGFISSRQLESSENSITLGSPLWVFHYRGLFPPSTLSHSLDICAKVFLLSDRSSPISGVPPMTPSFP